MSDVTTHSRGNEGNLPDQDDSNPGGLAFNVASDELQSSAERGCSSVGLSVWSGRSPELDAASADSPAPGRSNPSTYPEGSGLHPLRPGAGQPHDQGGDHAVPSRLAPTSAHGSAVPPTGTFPRAVPAATPEPAPSAPTPPGGGLPPSPTCRWCYGSGQVYAWFLIAGQWHETIGPCVCLDGALV